MRDKYICIEQVATMTGNMSKLQKLQMDSIDSPYYFKTNNMTALDIKKVNISFFEKMYIFSVIL